MYILILSIPFTTSIFLLLFGRYIGIKGTKFITINSMTLSIIIGFIYLKKVLNKGQNIFISISNWLNIGILEEDYKLEINKETSIMTNLILIISTLVIIYSFWYLSNDPHLIRFISYLLIFSSSMLLLVNSKNLLFIFLGWETVGLSSYLLINYWYNNINSNKSAIKAILYNKIGDITLLLSIFLMYYLFPNTNISNLYNFYYLFNTTSLVKVCGLDEFESVFDTGNIPLVDINNYIFIYFYYSFFLFIIVAVMAKSSQFFLHPWLGDAMAGPTPVSALLHAATMVTAGIFLLIRLNILFDFLFVDVSNTFLFLLISIGLLTIFLGGFSSLAQNDIKKIIAFSTASQLGYMFIANTFLSSDMSFYHLLTHGFFKALLFLTAGLIIHNLFNEQDLRRYGSFLSFLPLSYLLIFVSSLSLSSFPFLSGFFSKDLIIEISFFYPNLMLFILLSLGGLLTIFYSFRLIFYSFFSFPSSIPLPFTNSSLFIPCTRSGIINSKGSPLVEIQYFYYFIFYILALGSIFLGFLLSDLFTFNTFLEFHFYNSFNVPTSYLVLFSLPLLFFLFLLIFLPIKNINFLKLNLFNNLFRFFYILSNRKFFIDSLLNSLSNLFFKSFYSFYKSIDSGLLESFSPLSFFRLFFSFPHSFRVLSRYNPQFDSPPTRPGDRVDILLDGKFLFFFLFFSLSFFLFIIFSWF